MIEHFIGATEMATLDFGLNDPFLFWLEFDGRGSTYLFQYTRRVAMVAARAAAATRELRGVAILGPPQFLPRFRLSTSLFLSHQFFRGAQAS